ncbi:helix-turn-helix domain-containing protein [Cellulosimicrobium cellulans]|uniref:helix-turn-helix domain-containing protein n=1 Tax=Cellulosimicrobium cellulans TaxID=1710 RepID=UPI00214A011D|nr:helix-turn-helix domain-containing protein [Cellulosimicrobium cellulans]
MALPDKPYLPRQSLLRQETTAALKNTAWQIGIVLVVARHRKGWTQEELARRARVEQGHISAIENGRPVSGTVSDDKIDALFAAVGVNAYLFERQIGFVKYWRDIH